jgi:hypothetical protein
LQKNVLNRRRRWRTRSELAYEIVLWIEHTYNRRRRQRALGKLTPVAFEFAFTTVPCRNDDEESRPLGAILTPAKPGCGGHNGVCDRRSS